MEIQVYADVLFAFNYLMDLIIVFASAILARIEIKPLRISLTAAFLAVYSVLAFMPQLGFAASAAGRALTAFLGMFILNPTKNIRILIKQNVVFWLITAALGGGVTALCMTTDLGSALKAVCVGGSLYADINLGLLITAALAVNVLILGFKKICVRNFGRDKILLPIDIYTGGAECSVIALIDTGCELTVPLTGEGIILVPEAYFGSEKPKDTALVEMQTAGGKSNIEIFYPDRIECRDSRYKICPKSAVGLVEDEFAADGLYTAILNPQILIEAV